MDFNWLLSILLFNCGGCNPKVTSDTRWVGAIPRSLMQGQKQASVVLARHKNKHNLNGATWTPY